MVIDVFNHFMPKAYLDRIVPLIPDQPAATAFPRLQDADRRRRAAAAARRVRRPAAGALARQPAARTGGAARHRRRSWRASPTMRWPKSAAGIRTGFPTFIAALPMNNIEATLAEIDRAIGELGARGIQVFTNVAGKPLSAPEFRPMFRRMVEHDLPVWVHPMRGAAILRLCEREGVGGRDLVHASAGPTRPRPA